MSSSNLTEVDDMISNLPDSLICYILSFLDTKLSISTCVLSKRWKFLWRDVPSLYFCSLPPPKHNLNLDFHTLLSAEKLIMKKELAFEKFVTMSLFMNKCQTLDDFSLVCSVADRLNVLPAWLNTVISKNVCFLELNVVLSNMTSSSGLLTLPNSVFTTKSLETLILEGDLLVQTPSSVSLPKLEYLSLKRVKYDCDESVRKLIKGCSAMETLYIERNEYDNVVVFTVNSESLTHLEIYARGFAFSPPLQDHDHVEYLKLEINASNLEYLHLCDCVSEESSIENLYHLRELHLFDDDDYFEKPYFSKTLIDSIIESLSEEFEILTIGAAQYGGIFHAFAILPYGMIRGVFSSLRKLILTSSPYSWSSFILLLEATENLEVLDLKAVCKGFDYDLVEEEDIPRCLSGSLRKISICFLIENEDEIVRMMKYFLNMGFVLNKLKYYLSDSNGSSLLKKLIGLKRSSTACEIRVIY